MYILYGAPYLNFTFIINTCMYIYLNKLLYCVYSKYKILLQLFLLTLITCTTVLQYATHVFVNYVKAC